LADQAVEAKAAMARTLRDMGGTLTRVADVRSFAKHHPLLAIGSAALAGFVAAAALTPGRRKDSDERRPDSEPEPPPSRRGHETPPSKRSALFSTLASFLVDILRTVVRSSITAVVVARDVSPETPSPGSSAQPGESVGESAQP
jgi:hypothetical protein